jgi:hypothetical protein
MADPTNEQRKAIGAFVKGTLSPLIEEVLTKKLTQAAAFVAEEMRAEAALAESVTDEQIQAVWESMPGGPGGFRKQWGFNQFARAILALTAHDSGVPAAPVPQPPQWPAGLLDRIKAAEQRIADNHAPRRIPADPHGDVDLVLAEVRYLIEGCWPPFWIKDAAGVLSADDSKGGWAAHVIGRELLRELADALAARCGTNAEEWPLIEQARRLLDGVGGTGVASVEAPSTKPCPECSGGNPGLLDDGSGGFSTCDECGGTGTVGVTAAPAPAGPLQQMAAGIEALDAGHDPLCMAVLRGKACTCGVQVPREPKDNDHD